MDDYAIDLGLWGLFASAFISSTIAPGGSEAVLAYMVAEGIIPVEKLIAVATVGNTLGALTTWWLGNITAKKYPADKVLSKKHQKSISSVQRWGRWSLLFSWLPVIGDGLCFAGGWLKLPFWTSSLMILLGKATRYSVVGVMFI
jgi:membrane protein YqaA with SNARE-associated domain